MRMIALGLMLLLPLAVFAQDPARLRAKAALALALAEPGVAPATYAERYAAALRESKPLLVWVGQPARSIMGCIHHVTDTFPGLSAPAVIVGVPTGTGALHRVDLPGRPTDADIRAALAARSAAATPWLHLSASP